MTSGDILGNLIKAGSRNDEFGSQSIHTVAITVLLCNLMRSPTLTVMCSIDNIIGLKLTTESDSSIYCSMIMKGTSLIVKGKSNLRFRKIQPF